LDFASPFTAEALVLILTFMVGFLSTLFETNTESGRLNRWGYLSLTLLLLLLIAGFWAGAASAAEEEVLREEEIARAGREQRAILLQIARTLYPLEIEAVSFEATVDFSPDTSLSLVPSLTHTAPWI
jgi:hypothetical protein